MGMVFISGLTEDGMRGCGRMESSMVRASTFYRITQSRSVSGKMGSVFDGSTSIR